MSYINNHKFDLFRILLYFWLIVHPLSSATATEQPESNEELQHWGQGVLTEALDELSRMLAHRLTKEVTLKVYESDEFEEKIGSAAELNALFHDGTIAIVARTNPRLHLMKRTIRHEAIHAAVAQLADSKCPAWLEEGLAQLFEGRPPMRLTKSLRKHLSQGNRINLSELQDSFTLLPKPQRLIAYAASRFVVRSLINTHGYTAIRDYLLLLKISDDTEATFQQSFSMQSAEFEEKLHRQLQRWAVSDTPLS